MDRVIAYIDGHNLYNGLKSKGWKRFYWLNIQALVESLLLPHQTLSSTKYFTTRVSDPADKRKRQQTYLEALETLPHFELFFGKYLSNPVVCRKCGHSYTAYHEKQTDVNIAVEMLTDAFGHRMDAALLLSADSDLVGVVQAVRSLTRPKPVTVAFPPERVSKDLRRVADRSFTIGRAKLRQSLFPDQVLSRSGYPLQRPMEWR